MIVIVASSGIAGLVSLSTLAGGKSIKNSLVSRGYILAGESDNWEDIYSNRSVFLKGFSIKDSKSLKNICLKDVENKSSSRGMSFYEEACSLDLGDVIKKKNSNLSEMFFGDLTRIKGSISKNKEYIEKYGIFDSKNVGRTEADLIYWCKKNSFKPYSNQTKDIQEDLTKLCFA